MSSFEKSPHEIFVSYSGNGENLTTLGVESIVQPVKAGDKESPQTLFGKFSRIVFSMIRKGSVVKANVSFDELAEIRERTRFASAKVYESEWSGTGAVQENHEPSEDLAPAYTVQFTMGPFKGRTPADIVLENPEGNREKLQEQYKFLRDNAEKYPRNKKLMEAISNAYELYSKNMLTPQTGNAKTEPAGNAFGLYKSGYRPQREQRADGMRKVREMEITFNQGNRYPVELTINEFFAPVTTTSTGLLNVQAGAKDTSTFKKVTTRMSLRDWNTLLSKLDDQKAAFFAAYGKQLLEEADRQAYERIKAAREKTAG